MPDKYWRILNQLLTALMLVAAMIACQEIPEHNGASSIESESRLDSTKFDALVDQNY